MNTKDKISENLKKYREWVERVRSDWTMSEEAKRQDLAAAYTEPRSTHEKLAEEYRASIRENLKKRRNAVFSAPITFDSDKALQVMAYRDALDRAERTIDQRKLSDMLARAEVTGDAPLAKAILWRGYELQSEKLVHSYFEKYPDELPAWERFMGAAEAYNELEALGVSVPPPEEPQELRGVGVSSAV